MKEKTTVTIAGAQINPKIKKNRQNLEKLLAETRKASENGADLVVFPECALSGYMYTSLGEAMPFMETIPGESTEKVAALCKELKVHVIYGMLEKDSKKCYNAAALVGPAGVVGKYRKAHLPFLGIDRFVTRGDLPFKVHRTPVGRIGINICYDCTFPEGARVMALQGADIIVVPTNWPTGREKVPECIVPTRAYENRVFVVAVNRIGEEGWAKFIGHSKIADPAGNTLAEASSDKEEIIYAEINLAEARQKRMVFNPGEFEVDLFHDRRPDMYGEIAKK